MTQNELKSLTADFDDLKPLISERTELLNKTNKIRRRLKTKLNTYSFLTDLVGVKSNNDQLVKAVVKYFKALGFAKVENREKDKKEDIRLFTDDTLLLIEVTGTNNSTLKDNKIHQISKHIPLNQEKYSTLNVFGLFVVNHDNDKSYLIREKNPFNGEIGKIAKSHKYTITTTIDLLNAFTEFKNGNLSRDDIFTLLCTTGEIKINRADKSHD